MGRLEIWMTKIKIGVEYSLNNVDKKLKSGRTQRSSTEIKQDEKEDDRVLAAKLGQTLLEQNEELSSENNSLLNKIEVEMIKLLAHTMDFYLDHLRLYSKKTLFYEDISRLWKIATIPSLMILNLKC